MAMSVSQSLLDRVARTLFGNPGSKKPKKVKAVNMRRLQMEPLESREMLAVGPIADLEFPVPIRCDTEIQSSCQVFQDGEMEFSHGGTETQRISSPCASVSLCEKNTAVAAQWSADVLDMFFESYNDTIDYGTASSSDFSTTTHQCENVTQVLDWSYTVTNGVISNEKYWESRVGFGVTVAHSVYNSSGHNEWTGAGSAGWEKLDWTGTEKYGYNKVRTDRNTPLSIGAIYTIAVNGTDSSLWWYLGGGGGGGHNDSHDLSATFTVGVGGVNLHEFMPQITYNKGWQVNGMVSPGNVYGHGGVTAINVAKPNFGNFDPPDVDAILNPPQTITVTLAAPAEMESPFWAGTKAFCWSFFVSGPANLLKGGYNMTEQMVLTAVDVGGVSVDAIATLAGHPLGYEEMSVQGKSWYHSTGLDIAANAARAGLAGGTLGTSEMLIALCGYMNDGDADAFQQHMGGVAAGNLMAAGTLRGTKIGTTPLKFAPSNLAESVVGQFSRAVQNALKPQTIPRNQYPKPPGWTSDWEWGPSTRGNSLQWRWWDPDGGEWHYHFPDKHHPQGHWNYNPWKHPCDGWENIY